MPYQAVRHMNRRTFLIQTGGILGVALLVSACGSGQNPLTVIPTSTVPPPSPPPSPTPDPAHLYTYLGHTGGVYVVVWDPGSTMVASAGADLWCVFGGQLMGMICSCTMAILIALRH